MARTFPNAPARHSHSYSAIASSLELWQEYVDPDGTFSDEEFEAMSYDERIAIMVEAYGPEPEPVEAETAEDFDFLS